MDGIDHNLEIIGEEISEQQDKSLENVWIDIQRENEKFRKVLTRHVKHSEKV